MCQANELQWQSLVASDGTFTDKVRMSWTMIAGDS